MTVNTIIVHPKVIVICKVKCVKCAFFSSSPSDSVSLSHFRVALYVPKSKLSNEPHSVSVQNYGDCHFQCQMFKMCISDVLLYYTHVLAVFAFYHLKLFFIFA